MEYKTQSLEESDNPVPPPPPAPPPSPVASQAAPAPQTAPPASPPPQQAQAQQAQVWQQPGVAPVVDREKEARTWGMACHLSALAGLIGIPFGHIIGPLIVWMMKKDEYPFVDEQGKESLNFQISITIWLIVTGLPSFFLLFVPTIGLSIIGLIFTIIGAMQANEGKTYRYPLTIRFIK